jgi:hypothetical protein
MKLFIRTLVIALALTGAVATTQANGSTVSAQANQSKTSAFPIPSCPPSDTCQ